MACITTSPCSPSPVAGWSGRFSQRQSNRQGGYGENAVIRFSSTVWCETRTCAPCRHTPQGLVGRIPSEQTPFQRPRGVHGPQSLSLPNICHRMGGLLCWTKVCPAGCLRPCASYQHTPQGLLGRILRNQTPVHCGRGVYNTLGQCQGG